MKDAEESKGKKLDAVSDSQITPHSPKKKKTEKRMVLKVALGVLAVIVALSAFQYFSYQAQAAKRREAQIKQEEILVSHWTEQGLSDEEIQTKLTETRRESFNPDDAPLMFQILRTVRHATGTGPGSGGGPGSGMGDGLTGGTPGTGMGGGQQAR